MKKFKEEVLTFIDLSNRSLAANWGYSPVTQAEVRAMARDLKPLLHPKAVIFAMDNNDKPIGFALALPDVNKLIKGLNGRLFPLGIFRLLFGLSRLKQYRMFALGVVPEYHERVLTASCTVHCMSHVSARTYVWKSITSWKITDR